MKKFLILIALLSLSVLARAEDYGGTFEIYDPTNGTVHMMDAAWFETVPTTSTTAVPPVFNSGLSVGPASTNGTLYFNRHADYLRWLTATDTFEMTKLIASPGFNATGASGFQIGGSNIIDASRNMTPANITMGTNAGADRTLTLYSGSDGKYLQITTTSGNPSITGIGVGNLSIQSGNDIFCRAASGKIAYYNGATHNFRDTSSVSRVTIAGADGTINNVGGNYQVNGTTVISSARAVTAVNLTSTGNTALGDAATDTVGITGKINTNVLPTGSVTLGDTSNRWYEIWGSALNLDGNIVLGSDGVDVISANGSFDTALNPSTDNAQVLGTQTLRWKDLHLGTSFAQGTYSIRRVIRKTGLAGSAPVNIFSITTTDQTGDVDGGSYCVEVEVLAVHGTGTNATSSAVARNTFAFSRAMIGAATGVNSAVDSPHTGSVAATNSATRDITSVALTATEASEFVNNIAVTVNTGGVDLTTCSVVATITLTWSGFTTVPTIAAL